MELLRTLFCVQKPIRIIPIRSCTLFRMHVHFSTMSARTKTEQKSAHDDAYDLLVIGGGPGGYVAAIRAAQLGLKTVCVEKRGFLGGTCLNVGCIPSKSLLHNSYYFHLAKTEFQKRGIDVEGLTLNLPNMMLQKTKSVTTLTAGIEMLFKKNNVTYVKGHAKILSPNSVEVCLNEKEGSTKEAEASCKISAKNILIATGSQAVAFPGVPFDEEFVVSSTGALSLPHVPQKMVVVGGGIIGLELGSVWSRLGAAVTVVEYLEHVGGMDIDRDASKAIRGILQKQGIAFELGAKVTSIKVPKSKNSTCEVAVKNQAGIEKSFSADVVLVSIGRKPFTDGLGLDAVGIRLDDRGRIPVDASYKTSLSSIRAIGDVISGPMLAHKAEEEGIACVESIKTGVCHVNYSAIPSVIYTHPEVAWVGASEEQLKQKGTKYSIGKFPFLANSRAKTNDDFDGFVKVLADESTDKILGVHIVGPGAAEMIAEAAIAVEYGASSEDIARTCHAHPVYFFI